MTDYPDKYNDLLPVNASAQTVRATSSNNETSHEETSDAPQEGSMPEKTQSTSDFPDEGSASEKVQTTTDTPREGSTSDIGPTTSDMTYAGSFAEMVPAQKETCNVRCTPERVKFQLVEPQGMHICDGSSDNKPTSRRSSSLNSSSIVQGKCSTNCAKKSPNCIYRVVKVEKDLSKCRHSDTITDCSARNSQLPPIISAQTEAAHPTEGQPPSKCDICMYRRSIENWQGLKGAIYCPKCQHFESPLLRTKKKKTKSYFNSSCLVHCWPLCFLPYLFATPPQHFLHCAQCFKFLGTYDEYNKCVRPNREYLDCGGCFSAVETKRKERLQNEEKWREYLNC